METHPSLAERNLWFTAGNEDLIFFGQAVSPMWERMNLIDLFLNNMKNVYLEFG